MAINTTTNLNGSIDASNAGVFSDAAYQAKGSSTDALGPNWHEDTSLTVTTASTQMRVFVNDATKQVVFAFRGTDNLSNGVSDIKDSGASAYREIHAAAKGSYGTASTDYSGYQIITTGHSLGGGMAQSF
jgi:putative lipase involved disintegration of autophagic bodies